jgi:MFS family permease
MPVDQVTRQREKDLNREADREAGFRYQNPFKVGIILLIVGIAVACIQYKVPTIMIGIMALFHMDAAAASWLMSIFTLVGIFVAIPSGILTQRFGFKKMMLVALGLVIVGSFVGLVASAMESGFVLIVSRAIEGVALTIVSACGPIAVNQCVRPERVGTAMGFWGNWGSCGSVIAALVAPTLFGSRGFFWVWIAFAAFTALAVLLFLVFIHEPRVEQVKSSVVARIMPVSKAGALTDPSASSPQKTIAHPPRYRELASRDTALFLFSFVCFNLMLLALLGYLPSILQMQGFDTALSGFASTFPLLLSMLSVPVFGMLSDRLGRVKPLLVGTFVLLGPCIFVMYTHIGPLLWIAGILLGSIGFGCIGLFLVSWSRILPRPELISLAMGVLILVQSIGQFLGTYVVQLLLGPELTQWHFVGMVILAIGLAGSVSLVCCRFR